MRDLIDRNAFIEEHCADCRYFPVNALCDKADPLCTSVKIVTKLSEVDAVEVVRCKDCKHWHKETGWCHHHSHFVDSEGEACHPWESSQWKMLEADDYCSYGEKETDGK